MALTWLKTINIGRDGVVYHQGLLRSDGHWMMWIPSDHREYMEDVKRDLEALELEPDRKWNDGGEEEFVRFFEEERKSNGFEYMNDVDVFAFLK